MKYVLMVLVVLVLMLVAAMGTDNVALVTEATPLDEAAATIFKAVYAVVFIPMAAPLVEILTSGLKMIPGLNVRSQVLAFGLNVVIWVGFQVMNHLGYGGYFDSVIDVATTIGTMVIAIFGTQVISGRMYDEAKAHGVPVMGYKRPEIELAVG